MEGQTPDPAGSGARGVAPTINLGRTAIAHPLVRYKEHVLEVDVHLDQDGQLYCLLICPKCRHQLRVHSSRKAIEFDPEAGPAQNRGRLSIERFQCTWEIDDTRQAFGLSLCKWTAAIEDNIAKDA